MSSVAQAQSVTNRWAGRRVTVMGLGQFGGGAGAVNFLLRQGALVTLTDLRSEDQLRDSLTSIPREQLAGLVLGEHRAEDFEAAQAVIVNPAVKPGNRFVEMARAAGAELSSEMNLFWEACAARKIVVTGSVGKSTTATLIHLLLRSLRVNTALGGNIGVSLLPQVEEFSSTDWVVLELSSFQLQQLQMLRPNPQISVVTNLHPNHLDWHGTLEDYRVAKQVALRWQSPAHFAVLNADDTDVVRWPGAGGRANFGSDSASNLCVRTLTTGWQVTSPVSGWQVPLEAVPLALQPEHMRGNVAAALAALECVRRLDDGVAAFPHEQLSERIAIGLREFSPLPHRMNDVAVISGRRFINDSKATTPEATIAAMRSLKQPVWLIAGGKDKGVSLHMLAAAANQCRGVVVLGETGESLRTQLATEGQHNVHRAGGLAEAVHWCWEHSAPGDAILLSPACASEAPYANYERRGDAFIEIVQALRRTAG